MKRKQVLLLQFRSTDCVIPLSWSDGIMWSDLLILNTFCFCCWWNCSLAECCKCPLKRKDTDAASALVRNWCQNASADLSSSAVNKTTTKWSRDEVLLKWRLFFPKKCLLMKQIKLMLICFTHILHCKLKLTHSKQQRVCNKSITPSPSLARWHTGCIMVAKSLLKNIKKPIKTRIKGPCIQLYENVNTKVLRIFYFVIHSKT